MSMLGLVMAMSLGQVPYEQQYAPPYAPPPPPATVVIQLSKGAVLTIERLHPAPPRTSVYPLSPEDSLVAPSQGASVVVLPAQTVLTIRVLANRPYAPVIRPGTPMIIALPGGGAVNIDPLMGHPQPGMVWKEPAQPYALVLSEPSRLVLSVPLDDPNPRLPPPGYPGPAYNTQPGYSIPPSYNNAPAFNPFNPFRFR